MAGGTWLDLSGRRCESMSLDGSAATTAGPWVHTNR